VLLTSETYVRDLWLKLRVDGDAEVGRAERTTVRWFASRTMERCSTVPGGDEKTVG